MAKVQIFLEDADQDVIDHALEIVNSNMLPPGTPLIQSFNEYAKAFLKNWILEKYGQLIQYKISKTINGQKVKLNLSRPSNIDDLEESSANGVRIEFEINDQMKEKLQELFPFINETNRISNGAQLSKMTDFVKAIIIAEIGRLHQLELQKQIQ